MQIILLEGPDGGGKSTLARQLAEITGSLVKHNGPPPWGNIPTLWDTPKTRAEVFWWQLKNLAHGDAIVDRSWPSEQVYGSLLGRPPVFHRLMERMFERYMWAYAGVVVMCLPPYEVAYKTWRARALQGREILTDEWQFAEMFSRYEEWISRTAVPVIRYDFTGGVSPREIADRAREHRQEQTPRPIGVYGNPDAQILVVGERYNVRGAPEYFTPLIPFVGTGRSGVWLAQQFERMDIRECDLAWVNAIDGRNGEVNDPDNIMWQLPSVKLIIGLGAIATSWAKNAASGTKARVIAAPHPAYWTRFHAAEEWPLHQYKEDLLEHIITY